MKRRKRPNILMIAGFDPSSGAGITADIKTSEQLKCYGLGVCTAITVQNEEKFLTCEWVKEKLILDQIDVLFEQYQIEFVKIGIVENWIVLKKIIERLKKHHPTIKIILDPILTSTTGYDFHEENTKQLEEILKDIYVFIPNVEELKRLYPNYTIEEAIKKIQFLTTIYLKGGHREEIKGKDELFTKDGKHYVFNPKLKELYDKHGSGCVLSTALTCYLARDFKMMKAAYRAKRYVEQFLASNKTKLGFHK